MKNGLKELIGSIIALEQAKYSHLSSFPEITARKIYSEIKDFLKLGKTRTNAQNRSLHLYLKMISDQLNNEGHTFQNPIGIEMPYTMLFLKEIYWKPIQKDLFDIDSTKDLTTEMINTIIDVLSKHFGNKGIYVEWPCIQTYLNKIDEGS